LYFKIKIVINSILITLATYYLKFIKKFDINYILISFFIYF